MLFLYRHISRLFLHKDNFYDLFVPYVPTKGATWRGDRVVEGARLESECAPQGYRGFESLPLRHEHVLIFKSYKLQKLPN